MILDTAGCRTLCYQLAFPRGKRSLVLGRSSVTCLSHALCITALGGSDDESRPLTSPNQGPIHLFPLGGKDCDVSGVLEASSWQACILDDFFLVGKMRGTHSCRMMLALPSEKNWRVSSTRSQTAALLDDTQSPARGLPYTARLKSVSFILPVSSGCMRCCGQMFPNLLIP